MKSPEKERWSNTPAVRKFLIAVATGSALIGVLFLLAMSVELYASFIRPTLWYWKSGTLYRYDVEAATSQVVTLPGNGSIELARLNPVGRWIAYTDDEGLKI